MPPLYKAELLKIWEPDAKPQWVYASMLVLSTPLWRREVPGHEYLSSFRDKKKFTDLKLDGLALVMDSHAVDTEAWCLESTNDEETDRLRAFVLAVWNFTVTSLSAYRGKRGLDPKGLVDAREAEKQDHGLPARSQGCTGAAEEEVVERRPVVMKAKVRTEGDHRSYTAKPGREPMDVACAPLTACRVCKNAGRGVKHHWFNECPGFY